MLRLANWLHKYRSLVLVLMVAPVLGLFFSSNFHLETIPPSPHIKFDLTFEVPSRSAEEIHDRVTLLTEKILNGLPGLLSLSSETKNERVIFSLIFHEGVGSGSAYLNIQEKMDRIRLMLPSDVKSWNVEQLRQESAADLRLEFEKPVSMKTLSGVLAAFTSGIESSNPSLSASLKILVKPDPKKLARQQLPLSELVAALQSLGMETAIGRSDGVMFETGMAFESLDDVKSAPVGARGHRALRLADVADVEFQGVQWVSALDIWLDTKKYSIEELSSAVRAAGLSHSSSRPFWREMIRQSAQPVFLVIMVFVMQLFVIRALKLPIRALPVFAIMGAVVGIHFLFWKGLIVPPLTVLDLHALALTLMIGSIYLAVLYARIRTFFYEDQVIQRPKKTLDQAKLFALAELVPTFLVLSAALWLMSLPTMTSGVNLPARLVANSFFYLGLPILFFVMIVTPLSTATSFLLDNIEKPKARMNWKLSEARAQYAMWGLVLFLFMIMILFNRMNFGISYELPKNQLASTMIQDLRGYGESLVYKSNIEGVPLDVAVRDKSELQKALKSLEFSRSSLSHLGGLDLGGFTKSLEKIQSGETFGYLKTKGGSIPLSFSAQLLGIDNFSELLLADKTGKKLHKPIRVLTGSEFESRKTVFLRDNFVPGSWYRVSPDVNKGTFATLPKELQPTPWADYLLEQFRDFKDFHLISLIFLFFLFAIYLNSFIRSGLLMIFVLSTAGFVYLLREILPTPYHLDSLWLLYMGPFMALFQILVLTRVIDIERSRGYDRDLCIEETKEEFAPTVYICSWVLIVAIFISGLSEYLPGLPTLGLWKEGIFISLFTGVILLVSAHILFPLFYMTSEEFVDRILFRIYKLMRLRSRK